MFLSGARGPGGELGWAAWSPARAGSRTLSLSLSAAQLSHAEMTGAASP